MNQCVPSWNLAENPPNQPRNHLPSSTPHVPTLRKESSSDCEVAELTWQNGHLSMHGLGKPRPSGTLEAVVDQATRALLLLPSSAAAAAPHLDLTAVLGGGSYHPRATAPAVEAPAIPLSNKYPASGNDTCVASGSGDNGRKRARDGESSWESTRVTETCDMFGIDEGGFTTTSATQSPEDGGGSPDTDYNSLGGQDSVCHSRRSQDGVGDEEENLTKGGTGISSISTKRSRAASIHNMSERKRRDRINQKMRTLQKLVPNSSKTDKASMLDEVIEYLKHLQAQVQMMNRMNSISPMIMPMSMQHLQMSMMAQMAHMAQMGMGMGMGMMDLSPLGRPGLPGMPSVLPPSTFIPLVGASLDASIDRAQQPGGRGTIPPDPFPAFLGGPAQQPMNMDAYNKMVALYQQLYQPTPSANPNT